MFWADPARTLRRLPLLAPGGRMAFTHQPRLGALTYAAALEAGARMQGWLREAGLVGIRTEAQRDLSPAATCVTGEKPPK